MEKSSHSEVDPTNIPKASVVLGASIELPSGSGAVAASVVGFSSSTTYDDTAGLVSPLQALTGGFVLSPQAAPITVNSSAVVPSPALAETNADAPIAAEGAVSGAAAMAQALAQTLPQTPEELQALAAANPDIIQGVGQLDAEFLVGAAQRQGFVVGDVGVMVSYQDGSELTDMPTLYYLPNAPSWFLGMANLHGNMVPVFDLAAYLGVAQEEAEIKSEKQNIDNKRMLLVLAHGADAAGVVVRGIPQRLYIMQEQSMAPDVAPNLLLPHVSEAYFIENRVWFDLEVGSLLAALEAAM